MLLLLARFDTCILEHAHFPWVKAIVILLDVWLPEVDLLPVESHFVELENAAPVAWGYTVDKGKTTSAC